DDRAAVARDPHPLLRRLVGDADRQLVDLLGVGDLEVLGVDLAHRAAAVVADVQRAAVRAHRHRARLVADGDLAGDLAALGVDLAHRALAVVGDVHRLPVRGGEEVPGAVPGGGEVLDRARVEVDPDRAVIAHEGDVGGLVVGGDGDAAGVLAAERDRLGDLPGLRVDDGEVHRAPVRHEDLRAVVGRRDVLRHGTDLDDVGDLQALRVDLVEIAVGDALRSDAGVL